MDERKLYIPTNVSTENTVMKGLSLKDCGKSAIRTVIVAIVIIPLSLLLNWHLFVPVLSIILAFVGCCFVYTKFETNLSIDDYIKIWTKFTNEQKRYYYKFRRR